MKSYGIKINGMHCSGCKSLITMSLEDEGFQNVQVDEKDGHAVFDSEKDTDETAEIVEKVFKELTDYSYSNLEQK
jgi:copper chaperone CopZ